MGKYTVGRVPERRNLHKWVRAGNGILPITSKAKTLKVLGQAQLRLNARLLITSYIRLNNLQYVPNNS